MINSVYRLTSPRLFEESLIEIKDTNKKAVVRPTHLSICQADQRYYQGNRDAKILNQKLPMALIHEAIGKVMKDPTGTFQTGDMVVMIPNTPHEKDEIIAENYLRSSEFKSSGSDGFLSDYVFISPERLVKLPENMNLNVAAFTELISVSMHAISRLDKFTHKRKDKIGVWGDGNLGYITSLLLKIIYPESKIFIFGVNPEKLSYFSFTDERYEVSKVPDDLAIDHAFECVGGTKSQDAIDQIIDIINPEGSIGLLGVSEYPIPINTRMVLEKGLNVFGSSRSGRKDFEKTLNLISKHPDIVNYLENLTTNIVKINSLDDISKAFIKDLNTNFGKTILLWNK